MNQQPVATADQVLPAASRRSRPRRLKAGSKVILEMLSSVAGGPQLVSPLEISEWQISFEYTRFVYAGSACSIVLKTPSRGFVRLKGTVVRCDCPQVNTFHITARFESRLDLDAVLGKAADS